jgi:nucleotide-binding universal stress UspA family protein
VSEANVVNIQHILVPTDFSTCSSHALNQAIQFGRLLKARLTLLHVVQIPALVGGGAAMGAGTGEGVAIYVEQAEAEAHQLLAEYAQRVSDAGLECDTIIGHAAPFQMIVEHAETQHVDLIIMGTHGHTGLQHMLLGSVAEKVVRLACCPVMVTREPAEVADA